MDREEKRELLNELKDKLNKINTELRKSSSNVKLRIKRDKLKQQIRETENLFTDEDFRKMMESRSEIDVGKING